LINNRSVFTLWSKYIERVDNSIKLRDDEPIKLLKLSRAEVKLLKSIYAEYGTWDADALRGKTDELPEDILVGIYDRKSAVRIRRQLEEKAYLDLALTR